MSTKTAAQAKRYVNSLMNREAIKTNDLALSYFKVINKAIDINLTSDRFGGINVIHYILDCNKMDDPYDQFLMWYDRYNVLRNVLELESDKLFKNE